MVITLKTSYNDYIDIQNAFSFDLLRFDWIMDSKPETNEINFSRVLDGTTTDTTCISAYKYLTEKIQSGDTIKCIISSKPTSDGDETEIITLTPLSVSYYIKTLDDKTTQMEYFNISY